MVVIRVFNLTSMKKVFYLISIAATVASLSVSCKKAEEAIDQEKENTPIVEEVSGPETLTFAIAGNSETKTVLGESAGKKFAAWEEGDKIGSITTKSNGYSHVDVSSSPVTFSIYSKGGFTAGNTINVWYPYTTAQTDAANVTLSIPTTQEQYGSSFELSAMPMVAEQITVTDAMVSATDNTSVDEINFYYLGSLIDFKVFASSNYTTERVLSVTFNASSAIAGDFSKDLTSVDADNVSTLGISGLSETSVTTNLYPFSTVGSSKETSLDAYMVVAPGSYTGTVVVVTDAATYTWTISSPIDFNRAEIKSLGLQLDKSSAARVAHVKGSFTFDLSKTSYNSVSADAANWSHGILTMDAAKDGAGTATNNYIPPTNTSTRFYKNSTLTFTVGALQIEKVVFTATTTTYANALASSSWTNAEATADDVLVTIIPTDGSDDFSATIGGTTGHSSVEVFYDNNTYSVSKSSVLNGTIDSDVSSAKVNTVVNLTATPSSGYIFAGWTVTDSESNPVTVTGDSFKMPASNVTVSATFVAAGADPSITIAPCSNGVVETSPSGTVAAGTVVTITTTPNSGYELYSLVVKDASDNDVDVTSNQFVMPVSDVTITAVFCKTYTMTIDANASGNNNVHWTDKNATSVSYDGVTWTPSITWADSKNTSWGTGKDYLQIGANGKAATAVSLTTSGISGTILSVGVTCSSYQAKHSMTISVGGNTYTGANNQATASWTTISEITGTGSSSGSIVISFAGASGCRALYLKQVTVKYVP